jgi:hypothetical protein
MRVRAEPIVVPDRWPFFTVGVSGEAWICRAPLLPGERGELVRWFAETAQQSANDFALVSDETADPETRIAALGRASSSIEAAVGWVLCATWHDTTRELEASTGWRDGVFTGLDAKAKCGSAAVAEIADALSLTFEDLSRVARRIVDTIQQPGPSRDDVREVVHFFGTRTPGAST